MPILKTIAELIAPGIEGAAIVIVAYGAAEALVGSTLVVVRQRTSPGERKEVWLCFGVWLLFGLEFQLAAECHKDRILERDLEGRAVRTEKL